MQNNHFYEADKFYDQAVVIASGQSESAAIDLGALELAGVFVPTGFVGSSISFKVSPDNVAAYVPVQDGAGNAFSVPVVAGSYVPIANLAVIAGLRYIKLTGGVQTAVATLPLALRQI